MAGWTNPQNNNGCRTIFWQLLCGALLLFLLSGCSDTEQCDEAAGYLKENCNPANYSNQYYCEGRRHFVDECSKQFGDPADAKH